MAWSKKTWENGQKVYADDVNRWEDAIDSLMETAPATAQLDGTEETYKKVMRQWFVDNGARTADAAGLTALCDEWYAMTRTDWCGYSEAPATDVSTGSTVTKGGDNEGMTVTPSTDTAANQDDYAGLNLFACVDVNFQVTDDLEVQITAIDGITSNFKRTDPNTYVGVMQMSGWIFAKENSDSHLFGISAYRDVSYGNIRPYASAIKADGSVRDWVVHAKYASETVDGKLTSYSGAKPTGYMGHNTIRTAARATGTQYSGYTSADDEFLKAMTWIKYGMTLDGIMAGCLSMNYQYYAQVAESGVKRVILSTANAANLEVGMVCLIGEYDGSSADRGTAANYSVSGNTGATITAIDSVTINGTEYAAVTFDVDDTFDTGANGSATAGTTIVSTLRWITGKTDDVQGNDGSPISNTSAKYPYKLQGIELAVGGYDIISDTICNYYEDGSDVWAEPLVCDTASKQATSITDDYHEMGLRCIHNGGTSAAWAYIKREGWSNGIFWPIEIGGSSSTYTKDGFYQPTVTTTGARTLAARGHLSGGTSNGGAFCLLSSAALSSAYWYYSARLSPNGNRGEWVA